MGCKVFFLRTQLEEELIVLCDDFCDIKYNADFPQTSLVYTAGLWAGALDLAVHEGSSYRL